MGTLIPHMKARTIQILSIAFFVALLVWGAYTILYYIGVPVHGSVLLGNDAQNAVNAACGQTDTICRGANAFVPFILFVFQRAAPFLWYLVISVLVYLGFAGFQWMKHEKPWVRATMRPWQFLLLFLASLWAIFTVLSFTTYDSGTPVRLMAQPTHDVYNVNDQTLASLQQDFDALNNRGCLSLLGTSQTGAQLYNLSEGCIQVSFVTRVLPQVLFVLFLLLDLLVAGRFFLGLLKFPTRRLLEEAMLSVGLGAGVVIVALWTIAVMGVYIQPVGWALMLAIPVVFFPQTLYWLRQFVFHTWEFEGSLYDVSLLLLWLLVSYLALNFLTVTRPFPIGWDDLSSYLNRPRLLVSYGHFIYSMTPFDWAYLTSLGFLLFGYNNPVGATASMMVNWSAGLLALLAVFLFANTFLGRKKGMLATLLYYSLPLVGHFSFADMKIDNALFMMGALGCFLLFVVFFPRADQEAAAQEGAAEPAVPAWRASATAFFARLRGYLPFIKKQELHDDDRQRIRRLITPDGWKYFLLAGIFIGFAFAFKSTAAMVLMAVFALLLGLLFDWTAFVGALFFIVIIFSAQGAYSLASTISRITGANGNYNTLVAAILIVCLVAGASFCVYGILRSRTPLLRALQALLLFGLGFFVTIFPWVYHDNLLAGNFGIPRLELGAPNTITPMLDFHNLGMKSSNGQQVRALPPDLAVAQNNPACMATGSIEELDRYWGFSSGWGHYLTLPWRTVMNLDSVGYYVTTIPALLLFPLLLLLPYFWTRMGRWLRWVFAITAVLLVEWMFLANGVPWYGIGIFLGLMVGLEALVDSAPDVVGRWAASFFLILSLLSAFSMRFWQFEMQRNILEYPLGKVSAQTLQDLTIPYYDQIQQIAVQRHQQMPDRPYLYRVGTFIPYFIPKNLEVIGLNDEQLDVFNCLNAERDPQLTLKRLEALGFNSLVFDTNTATIESDPNGSLHKKVQAFLDFVNSPKLNLQAPVNDTKAGVAYILLP